MYGGWREQDAGERRSVIQHVPELLGIPGHVCHAVSRQGNLSDLHRQSCLYPGVTPVCLYSEEGACLHEYATYSCESKTSGKVMVCGGDVFCLDGECDKAQSGQSNDFAEAVSQLAALAAAGKDVAALNGGMSVLSPVRRNFVRRLQPDTATAVRTAAGDRISGWPNAAVMKRPWLKQNQTN